MKSILLLSLGLLLYFPANAQDEEKNEIKALKIAFITNALDLSSQDAQKFWPVYNKYETQEDILRANLRCEIYVKLDHINSMPDAEAETLLHDYEELCQQRHEMWEDYVSALKKVISPKKIMMLKNAEYNFHKRLLAKYKAGDKKEN